METFINNLDLLVFMEEILHQFNPWWEEEFKELGIKRTKYLDKFLDESKQKHITIITGLRRVGKTTLIKQTIEELLKTVPPKNILFVSLEHPVFDKHSVLDIVETYRTINGLNRKEKIYLFIDEIQYKEDFERELKILHDNEQVKIFISGSNSLILKDKKAFLTGRNNVFLIEPLDFDEFLLFNNIDIKKSEKYLCKKHFEEYLEMGGMPEYVLTKNKGKITSLVEDIIYKDIVGKHGVKNVAKLKELFLLLCERVGKKLSYNKLANVLGIKVDSVMSYISYFEEVFLIYQVNRYAKSLNEVVKSPKKIYISDIGIRNVFVGFKDKGALFENLVFLKIKHQNPKYYYENTKEIDFIVDKKAIEVKFKDKISDEELKALENIKIKEKIVVKGYEEFVRLE